MYTLDNQSDTPLYLQIVNQTKGALIKGYYREGDKLPSVRDLARDLLVNQSTISKAYKELEERGIIRTLVGRGTYIYFDQDKLAREKAQAIQAFQASLREMIYFDIPLVDIQKMYEDMKEQVKQ